VTFYCCGSGFIIFSRITPLRTASKLARTTLFSMNIDQVHLLCSRQHARCSRHHASQRAFNRCAANRAIWRRKTRGSSYDVTIWRIAVTSSVTINNHGVACDDNVMTTYIGDVGENAVGDVV